MNRQKPPPRSPSKGAAPPRAWQRMLSGRRLDLLDPSPLDIEIEDIAHGLARVARWNGQTVGPCAFSVAQHCLVVDQILLELQPNWGAAWQLAGLLHDAPEYVVGDLISPFKAALGYDYKSFEQRLLFAIHRRFGLPELLPNTVQSAIKRADRLAAYFEATVLAGFAIDEAELIFGRPNLPEVLTQALRCLEPWPTDRAQQRFTERVAVLVTGLQITGLQVTGLQHKTNVRRS
jgi:uncharacterized protein